MQKSLYPTWYEFKKDLQKELGRSILNQEWLHLKPEKPLPWNYSCFQTALKKLEAVTSEEADSSKLSTTLKNKYT
jgi:hypothetical protein